MDFDKALPDAPVVAPDQPQYDDEQRQQADGKAREEEAGQIREGHAVMAFGQRDGPKDVVGGVSLVRLAVHGGAPTWVGPVRQHQPRRARQVGAYGYAIAPVAYQA